MQSIKVNFTKCITCDNLLVNNNKEYCNKCIDYLKDLKYIGYNFSLDVKSPINSKETNTTRLPCTSEAVRWPSGPCTRCKKDNNTNYKTCEKCRIHINNYIKNKKLKHKELCIRCFKFNTDVKYKKCLSCREYNHTKSLSTYYARKQQNRCTKCNKDNGNSTHVLCSDCREDNKRYFKQWKSQQ